MESEEVAEGDGDGGEGIEVSEVSGGKGVAEADGGVEVVEAVAAENHRREVVDLG